VLWKETKPKRLLQESLSKQTHFWWKSEVTRSCFISVAKSESLYIWLHDLLKEKLRGKEVLITPYDVSASRFIERLAKYLKENVDEVTPPTWANIVKTGAHVEKTPQNPEWWYIRCASLLRKIYVHGPVGIEKLRAQYGGRKDYGVKPGHVAKAGGAILRKALQQLEAAGLVEKFETRGRRVTREGRKLLQELAGDLQKESVKEVQGLEKRQKGG